MYMKFFDHLFYKYISQVDERDCGVAALSMVLQAHKSDYSIAYLRELAGTDLEGTTVSGIVHSAQKLGFETRAVRADMRVFDIDIPYPFIAHVTTADGLLHFYTVFKKVKNTIIIGDPNPTVGLIRMPIKQFKSEWDGIAIFAVPEPAYKPKKENKNNLLDLLLILLKQRTLIIQIVLAALLITLISIIGSYYLQGLIDTYIPSQAKTSLSIISIGLIVAYIFQQIMEFAQNYLLTILGQRLSIDIILGYIKHLFELPMTFFGTRRTGEIVSRFSDANQIIDALASTIISLFLDVAVVLFVGSFLLVQNSSLFILAVVSLPLYAVIIFVFIGRFNHLNNERMQANSMLSSSIIEDIDGIETIKSLNKEYFTYNKVDSEFIRYLKTSFAYTKTTLIQTGLKQVLQLILNVLILWYGAILVIHNQMTLGELLTFNALLSYFTTPLQTIISLQTKIQAAKVANRRLNEVYLIPSEFNDTVSPIELAESLPNQDIKLRHVKFRYGFSTYILDGISLNIPKTSKVTLIGLSGSGKSTLVKLLVRFMDPTDGQIIYGDTAINEINKRTLRATINYLPQEPYIFSGTIRKNLTMGADHQITSSMINKALELTCLKDDIAKLPLQLDTEVSSDGTGLSGGQRQRLALARAVLADSPIMILDESTSNLDLLTERKILQNLIGLKDKTIIFIAHRLSVAKMTDNIIVLEDGKIVEQGTHDELIASNGFYERLLNNETGDSIG